MLLKEFILEVVAPLVAEQGDLNACYALIEHKAVEILLEKDMSPEAIAAHMGRSRTWVYGIRAELERRKEAAKTMKEAATSGPEGEVSPVQAVNERLAVAGQLVRAHPSAMSVRELSEATRVKPERLVHILEALQILEVVEEVDGRYRARSNVVQWQDRQDRLAGLLGALMTGFKLGRAYLENQPGILCQRVDFFQISPEIWSNIIPRLRNLILTSLREATSESARLNPDGLKPSIQVNGFVCIGKL